MSKITVVSKLSATHTDFSLIIHNHLKYLYILSSNPPKFKPIFNQKNLNRKFS